MDAVVGSIVVATITGILTLIGVIVSNMSSNKTIEKQLEISQAVTNEKLDSLNKEVAKHNHFAERIPVIETNMQYHEKRISLLEKYIKEG